MACYGLLVVEASGRPSGHRERGGQLDWSPRPLRARLGQALESLSRCQSALPYWRDAGCARCDRIIANRRTSVTARRIARAPSKKGAPGRCGRFDLPTVENLPKALWAFGLTVSHHGKLEPRCAPLRRCLKRSRGVFGRNYRIRTYDAERLYCDFRQAENGVEQAQRIFDAL